MALTMFPALQGTDGFTIIPSDTVNIVADANNIKTIPHVYVHNPSPGGQVKVLFAGSPTDVPQTIYLPQGAIFPTPVKRVFATSPVPPTGLIALFGGSK